jgi:hypothetical protein
MRSGNLWGVVLSVIIGGPMGFFWSREDCHAGKRQKRYDQLCGWMYGSAAKAVLWYRQDANWCGAGCFVRRSGC